MKQDTQNKCKKIQNGLQNLFCFALLKISIQFHIDSKGSGLICPPWFYIKLFFFIADIHFVNRQLFYHSHANKLKTLHNFF